MIATFAPTLAVLLVSLAVPALAFNAALNRINPLSSSARLRDNVIRLAALSVLSATYLFSVGYLVLISRSGVGYVPALTLMAVVPAILGGLWRTALNRGRVAE